MDVLHERCAGLDVHKLTVVACVVTPGPRGRPRKEVRTFGTTGEALLQLADWLRDRGVPAAALEATGIYWRPVRTVREDGLDRLLIVDERHLAQVLGEYARHDNHARPHRALGLRAPLPRGQPPGPIGGVVRRDRLGGLIHEYERAAA